MRRLTTLPLQDMAQLNEWKLRIATMKKQLVDNAQKEEELLRRIKAFRDTNYTPEK